MSSKLHSSPMSDLAQSAASAAESSAKTIDIKQAPSRLGDRYHYLRAARLYLQMLAPNARLQKVVVEGPSLDDLNTGGEDVIDFALYYGELGLSPDRVAYRRFKHSLVNTDVDMTASDVVGTLKGYAERFPSAEQQEQESAGKLYHVFEFETNRPISQKVQEAISNLKSGQSSREADYFREKLCLKDEQLKRFASRIRLIPLTPSLISHLSGHASQTGFQRIFTRDGQRCDRATNQYDGSKGCNAKQSRS